jgi:hypothetical protein
MLWCHALQAMGTHDLIRIKPVDPAGHGKQKYRQKEYTHEDHLDIVIFTD